MFKRAHTIFTQLVVILGFFITMPVSAGPDWHLNAEQSNVSFTSVKNGTIGENHHFTAMTGSVDNHGRVTINVPLASVESYIDIRNERMGKFLFEIQKFSAVTITAQLDMKAFDGLAVGMRTRMMLDANLDLHGVTSEIEMDVFVSRLSDTSVVVSSAAPVLVDADEFDMGAGIEKLRELASLDAIGLIVPVTFSLLFDH